MTIPQGINTLPADQMRPFLRREFLAAACLCAAHVLASPGALAAPAPPEARTADQTLQSLKDETLLIKRDLLAVERTLLFPDQSRMSLYVAVKVSGFLLDRVSVRIDEREPVVRDYSDSEARAFLSGDGWHRLLRERLEPGTHRLQAEFSGHFYDARPGDPPMTGRVQTIFEKGIADLDLVLPISRNTRLDKPSLSEISRLETRKLRPSRNVWLPQPQRYESVLAPDMHGTLNDPRYRSAVFLKEDGRYLSALAELLEIEQSAPDAATLPVEFQFLVADCYLGFGMQTQAQQRYTRIAAGEHDAADLARARLQLARLAYQRGYYAEALDGLNRLRDQLPSSLLEDWRLLVSSTLTAEGRFGEAVEVLSLGDPDDLGPVLRYNLGVALIRDGKAQEGRRELNRVGTMDVANLEQLVLRDKANLTLGYQYLEAQQGEDARTVFGRIRTSGPFSNRALLGLGWAEVAPVTQPKGEVTEEAEGKDTPDSLGTLLRPGYVDPQARARLTTHEIKTVKGLTPEEQEALLRALVPWVELAKRDPMDPAVQEGMLAIPWALDRLQDYEQSLARYTEAIATLETARQRMEQATRSIRGGRMVETIVRRDLDSERGWMWRLRDLPDAPETYFLQTLLAEHRFQEALKNYRDARLLTRDLEAWKARIEALAGPAPGTISIERQIERVRRDWQPPWAGTIMWLGLDQRLGAPGAYDAPATRTAPAPFLLQALQPPATFIGRREQLVPLERRVTALLPRTRAAAAAQDRLLESISLHELDGQKKTIERYLTEARFAVARIYDRQLKGAQ